MSASAAPKGALRSAQPAQADGRPMNGPTLCVVVHDVAETTLDACERLIGAIDAVAPLPLTLLAVPRYHHAAPSARLEHWLGVRSRGGDEIALHGWTHLDDGAPAHGWVDRLRRTRYTRGEGEFWNLDQDAAARRLRDGIDWFERNGWPLHGFVAPAWLLGPGGWRALRETRLRYTSTLRHIHLLPDGPRLTSQSIVYSTSSGWRRAASVVWAGAVGAVQRADPLLRLELHPHDADHAPVRRSWQRLLASALERREALTVAQVAERWRRADRSDAGARAGAPTVRAD
jgi:hypothetical protein